MNLLIVLNIINQIYEHELFPKVLTCAIILLIFLFILIFIIGLHDAKKAKNPPKIEEEDIKDITFDVVKEQNQIKEDVTFEMPVLTKNLEDFKKNLEEEIQKESEVEIMKTINPDIQEEKATKILDIKEIEDTAILPELVTERIEKLKENSEKEMELPKYSNKSEK